MKNTKNDTLAHNTAPSAKALGDEYARWFRNALPQFTVPIRKFVETLNLDALRTSASQVTKSRCLHLYHIATGGFNVIYLLTFENGRDIIARLSMQMLSEDQTLLSDSILSEAATLHYIQAHCSVPVPRVFAMNDEPSNAVGARYILEDRIYGKQLSGGLRGYTPAQRKEIVTQISRCEAEFIRTRFDTIGSIYHRAETDRFYVGPVGPTCTRPLNHTVDRGPWYSTRDWLSAYIKSELAGILNTPEQYCQERRRYSLDGGNPPVAYHIAWLEMLLAAMDDLQYLKQLPASIERPVLDHDDLSGGNILVSYADPTGLAAIVDFEGAQTKPLWTVIGEPRYCDIDDKDEKSSLLDLRQQILCEADPACAVAKISGHPLRQLRRLVSCGITLWCSIEKLQDIYEDVKEAWPITEATFSSLDKLIALGPAGCAPPGDV